MYNHVQLDLASSSPEIPAKWGVGVGDERVVLPKPTKTGVEQSAITPTSAHARNRISPRPIGWVPLRRLRLGPAAGGVAAGSGVLIPRRLAPCEEGREGRWPRKAILQSRNCTRCGNRTRENYRNN